jgi:hypothetical protein
MLRTMNILLLVDLRDNCRPRVKINREAKIQESSTDHHYPQLSRYQQEGRPERLDTSETVPLVTLCLGSRHAFTDCVEVHVQVASVTRADDNRVVVESNGVCIYYEFRRPQARLSHRSCMILAPYPTFVQQKCYAKSAFRRYR